MANSITSRQQVEASGFKVVEPGIVVNCPVVRTDDAVTGNLGSVGSAVGMPNTGNSNGSDLLIWSLLGAGVVVASGLTLNRKAAAQAKAKSE